MKKVLSLCLIIVLSFSMITSTFATSEIYKNESLKVKKVEKEVVGNNTTKMTTVFESGIEKSFFIKEISSEKREVYNEKNEVVAVITENTQIDETLKFQNKSSRMGSYYSTRSPYSKRDYDYRRTVYGDVRLKKALGYLSTVALGAILNVVAPGLGSVFAVAVIGNDVYHIMTDESRIYYKKKVYYHENLGSLEKMFKTKFYFESDWTNPATGYEINYSHFG